jgi:hydrogenase expression/formation protein HypC
MCLGIPGEVASVSERDGLPFAEVRFGGVTRQVCLVCTPGVVPGDFVLVHVGLAIAKIDRDAAGHTWEVLAQLGQTAAELGEPSEPSAPAEPSG